MEATKKVNDDTSVRDTQWVQRMRKGSKNAFESMYHFYYPRLAQFAYRYVNSRIIAEDLVHNVFFNIWKKRESLKGQTLQSYLYTSVRNQAFKYLERKKVRNFVRSDYLTIVDSKGAGPEDVLQGKELNKAIINTVKQLPKRRRLIFLMHREDDLTYREIAQVLDISIKTVETQMSRSLKFLRHSLSEFLVSFAVIFPLIFLFLQ